MNVGRGSLGSRGIAWNGRGVGSAVRGTMTLRVALGELLGDPTGLAFAVGFCVAERVADGGPLGEALPPPPFANSGPT